jgi:hypothetical protein
MLHLIPTRSQWRKWTLPSKLTAIGAHVGIFALLLYILSSFVWPFIAIRIGTEPMTLIPQLPEFKITTTPVDLPGRNDKPLTFSDIQNRRLQILTINNPNKIPLAYMQLWMQFPEAILSVKSSEQSASYQVEAAENWDKQQPVVTGDASDSLSVEPFASEEHTGL